MPPSSTSTAHCQSFPSLSVDLHGPAWQAISWPYSASGQRLLAADLSTLKGRAGMGTCPAACMRSPGHGLALLHQLLQLFADGCLVQTLHRDGLLHAKVVARQ